MTRKKSDPIADESDVIETEIEGRNPDPVTRSLIMGDDGTFIKVRARIEHADSTDRVPRIVGQEYEMPRARALKLESEGFVEIIDAQEEAAKDTTTTEQSEPTDARPRRGRSRSR